MILLFVILIVLACIVLGFVILVQNPKGGGLSSNIGGFSTQFMGVKRTTDVLEKGTWIFAGFIALLCLFSSIFIPSTTTGRQNLLEKVNTKPSNTNAFPSSAPPAGTQSQPVAPASNQK